MCPLCNSESKAAISGLENSYWHCRQCDLRYLDPGARLEPNEEKERYHLHEPGDEGYLRFVTPLIERLTEMVPKGAAGLDFGAGRFPVLSEYLKDRGYHVSVYDPYFWPEPVRGPFDFIVSCEVVEHLYHPGQEFARLYNSLRPGGVLVIQTDLVQLSTDFPNWYYRRDPTHVVFYSEATFRWIQERLGFSSLKVEGRVVSLTKKGA